MIQWREGLLWLLWLPVCCWAGARGSEALVSTRGLELKPIAAGKDAGKRRAEQTFAFDLGKCRYAIRYSAVVDPKEPGKVFPGEGAVGMPSPCSCNWYHSGFLFVRVNGEEVGSAPLACGLVAESGSRAIADLVWEARPARVRLRFAGRPGDDKLLCEIALEPKEEVRELRVVLRCYPSFFTSWFKREGARRVATPSATLEQGQNVSLDAAKHWYAVYYDTVFDVARGEGEGPCAMLLAPEGVETVKFRVGSYAVDTELVCRPEARAVRLAFWEFPQVANGSALAAFRAGAGRWEEELKGFDFTPAAVRGFDAKAELAELGGLTARPGVRAALGAKADEFRKRIEGLAAGGGGLGILQEAELLGLLAGYREFLWELRVAALLGE